KIAKSFVDGLGRGGREASFVRMIIELARTLGLSVIAEGIETPEQASALAALECEYGQGFHLGRPRPAEDARRLGPAALPAREQTSNGPNGPPRVVDETSQK